MLTCDVERRQRVERRLLQRSGLDVFLVDAGMTREDTRRAEAHTDYRREARFVVCCGCAMSWFRCNTWPSARNVVAQYAWRHC